MQTIPNLSTPEKIKRVRKFASENGYTFKAIGQVNGFAMYKIYVAKSNTAVSDNLGINKAFEAMLKNDIKMIVRN